MKSICQSLQLFFFLLALQIPTALAASFDCTKASTQVEKLICTTPILGQLDIALSENYRNIRASNIGDGARATLQTEQRDWMKQRNTCSTVACIERIYRSRLDEICSVPVLSGFHPPCKYSEDIGRQARETQPVAPAIAQRQEGLVNVNQSNCVKIKGALSGLKELAANHFRASINQVQFLRTELNNGQCLIVWSHPRGICKNATYVAYQLKEGDLYAVDVVKFDIQKNSAIMQLSMLCQ